MKTSKTTTPVLAPLHDTLVSNIRPALWVLLTAVVVLLLVACSNLAGLMLARASGRTRELAVRVALGATRAQIIRLMLSESLLLAVFSGALGILLAQGALRLIELYSPYDLPGRARSSIEFASRRVLCSDCPRIRSSKRPHSCLASSLGPTSTMA